MSANILCTSLLLKLSCSESPGTDPRDRYTSKTNNSTKEGWRLQILQTGGGRRCQSWERRRRRRGE